MGTYQPIPQTVTVEFDLVYAQAALNFMRSIIAALTKGAPLVAYIKELVSEGLIDKQALGKTTGHVSSTTTISPLTD